MAIGAYNKQIKITLANIMRGTECEATNPVLELAMAGMRGNDPRKYHARVVIRGMDPRTINYEGKNTRS